MKMSLNLKDITKDANKALKCLLNEANLKPGNIVVLGASTSEIIGKHIGSMTNIEVADAILEGIMPVTKDKKLFLAVQCCEHLNRALVVERECMIKHNLEQVTVYPYADAGGGVATVAMEKFNDPVVVEEIKADAGIDIGDTFIGMHIKPVGVPVRCEIKNIGKAHLAMIRRRPKLIGGERAKYKKC